MTEPLNFQSIILKLQEFWAAQGCLIWQPYYTQVGAGTMNPATFLRVLGPEPWNVAYVEPSIRPDDGRYGKNPNRFQQHYQFQVILKPDPGNPVELYIQSLQALGIDPRQHDIRLVEDNWEQPAISAWGLGWEIWLDGQEITQFTYFQQVGGQSLDPVSVEITYGLERILIALRDASSIWDEPWNDSINYGEVRHQEEYEHSKYYFEVGDVDRLHKMFELYEAEANFCLEQGLLLPAHDYVLKCSHTFNILDTRGAVGVTERQAFFRRMRTISRKVAEAYTLQRQQLEYPLLKDYPVVSQIPSEPQATKETLAGPQDFLLEIGVEELPASDLDHAINQLSQQVPEMLKALRLDHGSIHIAGTPRRLAVIISELADRQADINEEVKGPPAERAFDQYGNPTKAAEGFARGKGLDAKDLYVKEIDGGSYVFAMVQQPGRPTFQIMQENLPGLLSGIKFDKSMRWLPGDSTENGTIAFSRPIRWLVALIRDVIIPFQYASLVAGNTSIGLRPSGSPAIKISSALSYPSIMQDNGIMLEIEDRQLLIKNKSKELAASVGGQVMLDSDLLSEIANLVESPFPILGKFPEEYLALPGDVLISVMTKHQRYIPVEKDGKLLPYFVIIQNGDSQDIDLVRSGNEHVVRARFADADFFIREDQKHTLEEFRSALSMLAFHKSLGSMLDKSDRIEKLAATLSTMLGLDEGQTKHAIRSAHLSKADLVSRMVIEMTSLQGKMGAEFARRDGEPPEVALALAEQYQTSPSSIPGVVLAIADRLDSLAGLFSAGLLPSATRDPFALRRAALGVIQPLIDHKISLDLKKAIISALEIQPVADGGEIEKKVLEFITGRMRVIFLDLGFRYDVIDSVLAEQAHDPYKALLGIKQLTNWVARDDWNQILIGYSRCVRITRDQTQNFQLRIDDFQEPAEQQLLQALQHADFESKSTDSVDEILNALVPLLTPVNEFFDQVMVMVDDQPTRENRLALLQQISSSTDGVVDLSYLEGF